MTIEPSASGMRGGGIRRGALVALCAAGMILCGILIAAGANESTSFLEKLCAPSAHVNCASVLASRWSKFWGVSAALLGMVYFGGLLVWFVGVGIPNRAGRRWHWVPIGLTSLGICVSIYFTGLMATELGVWCTLCVAVHCVNLAIFIATITARPWLDDGTPYPSPTRAGLVLATTAGSVIVVALGVWSVQLQTAARRFQSEFLKVVNDPAYIEWKLGQQPVREIAIESDDLSIGRSEARNTVVVFSDFECLNCRMFDQFARRMVNLKMDVRIVFKHFPMSPQCNPHVKSEFHSLACRAALAAEAARIAAGNDLDKARKFHELLFERPERLGECVAHPEALAQSIGIEERAFADAMASDRTSRKIAEDLDLGHSLGVEGTPGIFLNGRRMKMSWHIVTNELHPQLDLDATDALWRRLLQVAPD